MRYLIVALALGACIYESGGTGGSGGGVGGAGGGPGGAGGGSGGTGGNPGGIVQVAWTLRDQMTSIVIPCRQDEMVLVSVSGLDTFPCNAMIGQVTGVPPGSYTAMIYLLDANRMVESSVSTSTITVMSGAVTDLGTVLFNVPNAIGDLHVSWEVQMGGQPVGCTGGETAEFGLDNGIFDYSCPAGVATLSSVRAGPYTFTSALKLGMAVETTGPSFPITIAPYTQTDAGHIVFQR